MKPLYYVQKLMSFVYKPAVYPLHILNEDGDDSGYTYCNNNFLVKLFLFNS